MSQDVRVTVSLSVSQTTADTIDRLAAERNLPKTGLFLQALGILHAVHDARKNGKYVGISSSRDGLETVLLDAVI